MNINIKRKKGFTLTELIVVIVIIGILAAVLIPTLTGYINKAKETAAKQEAQPYATAFISWDIENSNTNKTIDSFREYCVELELLNEDEAITTILSLNTAEKYFVVKAKNDMLVKCTINANEKSFEIIEELPINKQDLFFESVVKENLASINTDLKDIAMLVPGEKNADGSIDINVKIIDETKKPRDVIASVNEVLEIIKSEGGQLSTAHPEGVDLREFLTTCGFNEENLSNYENGIIIDGIFYVDLSSAATLDLGILIATALVYDKDKIEESGIDYIGTEVSKILGSDEDSYTLGDLIDMNSVKVIATIVPDPSDDSSAYDVVYNFDFVNYTE